MNTTCNQELLSLKGHSSAKDGARTLLQWLGDNASRYGDRQAIEGITGEKLTHSELNEQVRDTAAALIGAGLGRGVVVMVVLPNGPLALSAILSVAAVAVALPVGIEEPKQALSALLRQSGASAILFDRRHAAKAQALCAEHGLMPVAIDGAGEGKAGKFSLTEAPGELPSAQPTRPDDASILARTAGTGRAARLVAWSQVSLYRSVDAFADWAGLGEADRSLCVMPFAHMHSVVRSCLPVLQRGGTAICAPGFDRLHVLDWLQQCRPSFMTGVPAIYRAMVECIAPSSSIEQKLVAGLRFLAVGSDRMDAATVEKLDAVFGVPVREFYGMSEVSPMLAATAPSSTAQENGAVGEVVAGWTLVIRRSDGGAQPVGGEGEVCARGGLLNPVVCPAVGGQAHDSDRWYATGDTGFFDPAGRLHITGRVDDRIVRGGKKIAPAVVEAELAAHANVERAVVFPVPDDELGQVVGAVVIAARGQPPTVSELRAFLADRLADYMVPEHIVFADDLPRSATGKISRRRMAALLGLPKQADKRQESSAVRFQPENETEREILEIVRDLFEREEIDLACDFMDLGGDSFLATSLLVSIEDRFQVMPEPGEFLANGSVERLARVVDRLRRQAEPDIIVKLQEGRRQVPLFIAHGPGGNAIYAKSIAKALGEKQAVYVFQNRKDRGDAVLSMEEHGARFVKAMQTLHPLGPFLLAGHSFGAQLAFEVAQQLVVEGREVAFLAIIDDEADLFKRKFGVRKAVARAGDTKAYFRHMLNCYVTLPYAGDIDLFVAKPPPIESLADPMLGWGELSVGEVGRFETAGDHRSMMSAESIGSWIEVFAARLDLALQRHNSEAVDWRRRRMARDALLERSDVAATIEARHASRRGDLEKEIAAYRGAIRAGPEQPYWVFRNLAYALKYRGSKREALECFEVAAEKEKNPIIGWTIVAEELFARGKRVAAHRQLVKTGASAADDAAAHEVCARSWRHIGSAKQAIRHLQRSLELRPDNPVAEQLLADTLLSQRRFQEAERVVNQSLAKYPDRVDFIRVLGSIQRVRGDIETAVDTLRRAIQLDPTKPGLYQELSKTLDKQGELDEAVSLAQRATELLPTNAHFHLWLGLLLKKQRRRDDARTSFERAIELDPGLVAAQRQLSRLNWPVGLGLRKWIGRRSL